MVEPLAGSADFETLLSAWQSASQDFIDLVGSLSQEEWDVATELPGWTVGDVVAHVSWIERVLVGEFDDPHEPDWEGLPHAVTPFQRVTEIPVDLRRGWPREQVLIELSDVISTRSRSLADGPHDIDRVVTGPLGEAPLGRVLRMRTMDIWVHEQDIRDALGRPGHLDTPGAQASASQLLPGLAKVWGKLSGATAGQSLRVRIDGPGVTSTTLVTIDDDGRARIVSDDGSPVTVSLEMSWPAYISLSCGRASAGAARGQVVVAGDAALASAVLDNFNIML